MRPLLQPTGLGIGHSGGTLVGVAMAFCDRVDVLGAGLFSKGPGEDVVYQHHYDARLAADCAGPCLSDPTVDAGARRNVSAKEMLISRQVCQPSERCDARVTRAKGNGSQPRIPLSEQHDDFFFLSELRLPVLHVLGLLNWIWY